MSASAVIFFRPVAMIPVCLGLFLVSEYGKQMFLEWQHLLYVTITTTGGWLRSSEKVFSFDVSRMQQYFIKPECKEIVKIETWVRKHRNFVTGF